MHEGCVSNSFGKKMNYLYPLVFYISAFGFKSSMNFSLFGNQETFYKFKNLQILDNEMRLLIQVSVSLAYST